MVVILAFMPLVSGMYAPPAEQEFMPTVVGTESLLVLESGVWDSDGWYDLVKRGITPLRITSPDSILVWVPEGISISTEYSVEELNDVVWKPGLTVKEARPGDVVRVVFEPRLPVDVKLRIANVMTMLGGRVVEGDVGPVLPIPTSIEVEIQDRLFLQNSLEIEGVLWIEPVLKTVGRNVQSASIHQHGLLTDNPFWEVGLNGTGVILGVADGGIDADHSCFRNSTSPTADFAEVGTLYPAVGTFGESHRKIIMLNTSIDGNDTPGDDDYRHGTHVAGTLGCFDVSNFRSGTLPVNGSSLAHGSTLLVQDIVSSEGWVPPNVDVLLYESTLNGAFIHSNSWGDDTTAYTERTATFDGFAKAMPWSLAFIAPGNSGSGILEPANGRNVVSVGATTKAIDAERWGSSAYGPTEAGTDGLFILATGGSVQSAGADGDWGSNNNNLRTSSGTSMATPAAASAAGIIQQMYQDGWLTSSYEPLHSVPLSTLRPPWMAQSADNTTILLGPGFTPSGPLIRATLALASSPLEQDGRNGGVGGHDLHNSYDGWGRLNLSEIFAPDLVQGGVPMVPVGDVWVHDSYRLVDTTPAAWMQTYGGQHSNLSGFTEQSWDGSGAVGPFLKTGERFQQRFTPIANADVAIRLAYPAQPEPSVVDDLQLRITLPDGTVLIPDRIHADGSPTEFNGTIANFDDAVAFPSSNETTVGVNIPKDLLANYSYFDVEIVARYVAPGGEDNTVGLNGDRVGFGLVVQGVERDSDDHLDGDGDGVANVDDGCPNENAIGNDADGDGCLDDDDGDGVVNPNDDCPNENATGYDQDGNGCVDDSDNDGITDDEDQCFTDDLAWPVNSIGCYPVDNLPTIELILAPENKTVWKDNLSVVWKVFDEDGDGYRSGAHLISANHSNYSIAECVLTNTTKETMSCEWSIAKDLPLHYLEQGSFVLQLFVETTNTSPAASTKYVRLNVSTDITIDWPAINDEGAPALNTRTSSPPLLGWMVIGVALGGFVSFWLSRRQRNGVKDGGIPPPFTEMGLDGENSKDEE